MEIAEIKDRLAELSGKNTAYYTNVIPNSKPVLGVKTRDIRALAKQIAKEDYQSFLKANPLDTYEMEVLQAYVIGYAKDQIDILLQYFEQYVPLIHDWAVNDSLCQSFKMAEKYPAETFAMLMKFKDSNREFESRVVSVMLMSHYLKDDYIDKVIQVLDELNTDDYYSKMGVAWAVATIMAKYREKCFAYLKENHLDNWTYNKAIQKMIESCRIADEDKIILRTMKKKSS